MPEESKQYVTHSEFTQFAIATDRRFDEIMVGIKDLRNANNKSTNWGWVVGGVGVLMAFVTLYVGPINKSIDNLSGEFVNHRNLSGHPRMVERVDLAMSLIEKNTEGIMGIDTVLQREMRLLDEVLQREMGLHVERLDALIAALEKRLDKTDTDRFTLREGNRMLDRVEKLEGAVKLP